MRRLAGAVAVALVLALPAAAQESKPTTVQPKPKSGGPQTTFTVRYDAHEQEGFGGDQLYVRGPKGTRCEGEVVHEATGHVGGIQTIRMGPRVREDADAPLYSVAPRDPKTDRRLAAWCRGVYRGWVQWEEEDPEVDKHTRFRFRVR